MSSQVQLLVGTRKATFIYISNERREEWELSEPMLHGWVGDATANPASELRSSLIEYPGEARPRGRGQEVKLWQR